MNFYSEVMILDGDTFEQLFASTSPMRVSVISSRKPTKFQVETGETRSDHVVVGPIEIVIYLNLLSENSRDQYSALMDAAGDNRLVTVQTKMSSFDNMLIELVTLDESSNMLTGAAVPLRLSEWRDVQPEYGELQQDQVAKPEQSSTVKRGKQTGTPATPEQEKKGSVLFRVLGDD